MKEIVLGEIGPNSICIIIFAWLIVTQRSETNGKLRFKIFLEKIVADFR